METEKATTQLDSKLIANLDQAYEIQDFLKDDQTILPQFHIASSDQTPVQHKRISLYRRLVNAEVSRKKNFLVILRDAAVKDLIQDYLGDSASAFRVVIGSTFTSSISGEKSAQTANENSSSNPGVSKREDLAEILQLRIANIENTRAEYLKKVLRIRGLEAKCHSVQLDNVRLTQFLTDEYSADRLRLDALSTRLELVRQALAAEDVVLSRNMYISRCADINKSFLQRGLQTLQSLKQATVESDAMRYELLNETVSFIQELLGDALRFDGESASLDAVLAAALQSDAASESKLNNKIDQVFIRVNSMLESLRPEGVAIAPAEAPASSHKTASRSTSSQSSPSKSSAAPKSLAVAEPVGATEAIAEDNSHSLDLDNENKVIKMYAANAVEGHQQFQALVAQSMGRCVKLTLSALERKFMRVSNSPVSGTLSDKSDYRADLSLVGDHWREAGDLFYQIRSREEELLGAQAHVKTISDHVTNETKRDLQQLFNSDLEHQMAAISRVQFRLKAIQERVRQQQRGFEALHALNTGM